MTKMNEGFPPLRSRTLVQEHGSPESIAGYRPQTAVDEMNAIAYDQRLIAELLQQEVDGNAISWNLARQVYKKGAYSSSFAQVQIEKGLPFAVRKGQEFTGLSLDGTTTVTVKAMENNGYAAGTEIVQFLYDFNVQCHVGGNPDPEYTGCLKNDGELMLVEEQQGESQEGGGATSTPPVHYKYDSTRDNLNERSIHGFSLNANRKYRPYGNARTPYFEDFQKFVSYYGHYDYADQLITAAFDGQAYNFNYGTFDFTSPTSLAARSEVIQSAGAYMSTSMFVIREMEHAVIQCDQRCGDLPFNPDGSISTDIPECMVHPIHSVDSAVALYTGAVQAEDGDGNLLYGLANQMCRTFKTCRDDKTGLHGIDGTSQVNINIMEQFQKMQQNLDESNCVGAKVNKRRIAHLMFVPLVQGVLQAVYTNHDSNEIAAEQVDQAQARGIGMAAAMLPVLAHCSRDDAQKVYDILTQPPSVDHLEHFEAVKSILENHYHCMGISCQDVGGLWDAELEDYVSNITVPCGDPIDMQQADDDVKKGAAFGSMSLIFVAGIVLLFIVIYRRNRRRARQRRAWDDEDDDSLSSIESFD